MAPRPLPDWLLERYRLGELPPDEEEAVRRTLAEDARARERLDALDASDRAILEAHPPGSNVAAIRRRAAQDAPSSARSRTPRWLAAAPALAAALVVAVVVRQSRREVSPAGSAAYETRAKGLRPHLVAYRVIGGVAEALGDGATARPGDTLQLAYVSGGRRYGAIVSVDGRGQVTLHLPVGDGPAAAALDARREVALPRAYQLDDAPAFERFFFVTSDSPFLVERVLAAGRALASSPDVAKELLRLSPGLDQTTLSLRKVPP